MKTWRLRLVTREGDDLSLWTATVRYLACFIGPTLALSAYLALPSSGHSWWAFILLIANFAWAAFDRDGQFLHDRLAGTYLALEP